MLELYEEGLSFREEQERYLLRLGCMRSAQEYFLAGFLQDYLLGHPRCSLTLEDHHSVEIRDLLQEGLLDVGIVQIPLASRGLVSELLYEEPFLVVMKEPGHFQGKKIISMEELDGKQEIFQIFTEEFRSWHDQYWRALDSKIRVNSTPTAEKYFQGPEDWMLVPRSVAAAMKNRGFPYSLWRNGPLPPAVSGQPPGRRPALGERNDSRPPAAFPGFEKGADG